MKSALREAARAGRGSFGSSLRRFYSTPGGPLRRTASTIPAIGRGPSPLVSTIWKASALQRSARGNLSVAWRRYNSTDASDLAARPLPEHGSKEPVDRDVPSYDLTVTCKPCKTRSTHRISKQGYHKGTVLITCPNCKNRHLIADHLKIFGPDMTIDKFLEQQGEVVKRGTLGPDGDIEVWDHNTDDPSTGRHVGEPYDQGYQATGKKG